MVKNHADADDGWLEQALEADAREHAAAYVTDDGFTAKVMARLPAPATLPAWRRPVLALLWLIAGSAVAVALPAMPLIRQFEFNFDFPDVLFPVRLKLPLQ